MMPAHSGPRTRSGRPEVEPVHHRARVAPEAARSIRLHRNLAGVRCHVDVRRRGIAQRDDVQRTGGADRGLDRPLVWLPEGANNMRGRALIGKRIAHHVQRRISRQRLEDAAVIAEDRHPFALDQEPVDRTRAVRGQPDSCGSLTQLRVLERIGRRQMNGCGIERGQPRDAFGGIVLRHPRVDHDETRRKPDDENQAEEQPEIAMDRREQGNEALHGGKDSRSRAGPAKAGPHRVDLRGPPEADFDLWGPP